MKYNAFISYSHAADGTMARALQKALERFAKPWYKIRNLNIFRDESSLSATPHLWSNIQTALDESEYLIYLASPESVDSLWVQKEIEYWLEHKSLDTLLIGLTSGNIIWQNDSTVKGNSLPQLLIEAFEQEPFYIDLRMTDTKKDLTLKNPIFKKEVLKLAAQLHGKPPKDMASTEVTEHRKMVFIRNSAIVSLVVLLGFSVFQTIEAKKQTALAIENETKAIEQTKEAKKQQQIAIQERDNARKAKDETVPWVIRATWSSGEEYSPYRYDVSGFRALMNHSKSIINLEKIRFLSPVEVFKSGPHGDEFNWNSKDDFGHYNPEFIKWATKYLIPAADDEIFRKKTQNVYNKHLKTLARAYCRCYEALQLDKDLLEQEKTAYLAHLASGNTNNYFRNSIYNDYFNDMEFLQYGLFPYYADVASGFWIRREIDGTAEEFIKAIRKLIKAYDPLLYQECNNIKYPWSNAVAEFIPGNWKIFDNWQNKSFAFFSEGGKLSIQIGSKTYNHTWEVLGKDHFRIDGKDVKERFRSILFGLPELESKPIMSKLFKEQERAFDDHTGEIIESINATMVNTSIGNFERLYNNKWSGPDLLGKKVDYIEFGRSDDVGKNIFLYNDKQETHVNLDLYGKRVNITTKDQPLRQLATITDYKAERHD